MRGLIEIVREENAKLINEYPYGKGLMFKIRHDNMDKLKNLMTNPGETNEWLKGERGYPPF